MKSHNQILAAAILALVGNSGYATNVTVPAGGNIQSAINTVSASGGGTVILDSGTWTITSALTLPSNVVLDGAGTPATTLSTSDAINVIEESTNGISNVTVENLKVSGSGSSGSTNCQGVFIASTGTNNTSINVSNVQSTSFGGQAAELKRCNSSSVSSCNFHDSGATYYCHGLYVYQSTSVTVTGTSLTNSPHGTGFHLNGITNSVSISGSTCSGNGQDGMDLQGTPTSCTVNGDTCDNNTNVADGGYGINAQVNATSSKVENCTATGNAVANYNITGSGWTQSNNH